MLYATGLLVAVLPSMVVLTVMAGEVTVSIPWRTYGLLAGALLPVVLGTIMMRATRFTMSLALAALVIGSIRRLAAPFIPSLGVLPIEIIVVFLVQIGRTINPLVWWIALAVAGAVLLVIAITSERKGSGGGGIAARLHHLT